MKPYLLHDQLLLTNALRFRPVHIHQTRNLGRDKPCTSLSKTGTLPRDAYGSRLPKREVHAERLPNAPFFYLALTQMRKHHNYISPQASYKAIEASGKALLHLLCIALLASLSIPAAYSQQPASSKSETKSQPAEDFKSDFDAAAPPSISRPIPDATGNGTALSYHELAIDLNDNRNKEKLVKLSEFGIAGESFYARQDRLNAPYHQCVCAGDSTQQLREGVAAKLREGNKQLEKYGLELYVLDAYRPVICQKNLWRYFTEEAKRMTGSTAEKEIEHYAGKFCSNPTAYDPANYKTSPTHLTGGAVDLTLRRIKTGELLYMGGIFDDASAVSNTRHFESGDAGKAQDSEINAAAPQATPSASALEARRNRRILYWAMTDRGFANYPNEWWHFDYGNQMWVQNSHGKASLQAFYGAI